MKKFSHVDNFTGYMRHVFTIANSGPPAQTMLDIPAGNGRLSEKLKQHGHHVTSADINAEKETYVYADMEKPLPFEENRFDTVICLEGIEHILSPALLIQEFCRICKPDGRVIVSTPNIHNMFSRFQFLCTGTFFQFEPYANQMPLDGEKIDRGHISPVSLNQFKYLFACEGAKLEAIGGDKYKRKAMLPLLLPFIAMGWLWTRGKRLRTRWNNKVEPCVPRSLFSPPFLFSRSLILVFKKENL